MADAYEIVNQKLQHAVSLYKAGKYDTAIDEAKKILEGGMLGPDLNQKGYQDAIALIQASLKQRNKGDATILH